jgi:trimethyltridecatetraene/dimethylnonatriene synthase
MVLIDWELVKESFTTHDRLFANRPTIAIGKYVLYDSAAFAAAPYGQYWRELRKLATLQLLSAHRIELLQHVRVKEVDSFIKDLFRSEQKVVPLCQNLEQLTFNINTMLIVGKRFSAEAMSEKTSEVHRLREAIKEALHLAGFFRVV